MTRTGYLWGLLLFFINGLAHAQVLIVVDDSFGISYGRTLQVEATGVLENDSLDGEPAGDNGVSAELLSGVTNGTLTCPTDSALSLCADGAFDYTPDPGFSGSDSFSYRAVIGDLSETATVTLTACTEEGPQLYACWHESAYLGKLAELGYATFLEGFEGAAWDTVRTSIGSPNSAPEIISQGITWTTNHPDTNNITTGSGPARTGLWGAYDPNHGVATGTAFECDIDDPPLTCLYHDGLSGSLPPGENSFHGVGGYITGTAGAKIGIIIDEVTEVAIGKLPNTGHQFVGLVYATESGFSHFEFRELDGKVGQALYIWADDFLIATSDTIPPNSPPVLNPVGDRAVNEAELLSFVLTASDPDGDSLSISMDAAPAGSSLVNNGDGTATFNWTPGLGQAGTYPAGFTVTDNGVPPASDSEAITITVTAVPDANPFQINSGLNDAWYNPATNGQGFFITVYPGIGVISLSWFTYDTDLPGDDETAQLGDPGHRWLNALGDYSDDQAVMDISIASGGLFDTQTVISRVADGTIILTFSDCNSGTVEYDIPSINQQGTIPIRRVADDNIGLCEVFSQE